MEKTSVGGPTRNFCDPPARGQPDRFSEWVSLPDTKQGDYGGVHTNNGILNKAAYLIAEGGTHPDTGVKVDGIGRPALGVLYYAAEANVTSGFQFIDWRNMVVGIADQWAVNGTNGFTHLGRLLGAKCLLRRRDRLGDLDCDGKETRRPRRRQRRRAGRVRQLHRRLQPRPARHRRRRPGRRLRRRRRQRRRARR